MAVFLAIFLVWGGLYSQKAVTVVTRGVFGGPSSDSRSLNSISGALAFAVNQPVAFGSSGGGARLGLADISPVHSDVFPGSLNDVGQSSGLASRDNLFAYRVRKGDTLSGIASYFGVSIDTIVNVNPAVRGKLLRVGDELNILPISGVVYKTKDGDTLESIADYFNVPETNIIQFNRSINFAVLGPGVSLIMPGVKNFRLASGGDNSLPNFNSNFSMPTDGFNWGRLHHYNAVDIANSCGTSIRAAAEGLVVPDESFGDGRDGWNGGYGKFVLIEHPFGDGVRTRYAHLQKVLASIGDYVKQGQEIGKMGDTGDATGCHVHFEVYGAENPFAK